MAPENWRAQLVRRQFAAAWADSSHLGLNLMAVSAPPEETSPCFKS